MRFWLPWRHCPTQQGGGLSAKRDGSEFRANGVKPWSYLRFRSPCIAAMPHRFPILETQRLRLREIAHAQAVPPVSLIGCPSNTVSSTTVLVVRATPGMDLIW